MAEYNQDQEGAFTRSPAYRSLRNFTKFYTGKEKKQDIPSAYKVTPGSARGYLWRLSSRRMVYTQDWKRKYFVLVGERLYYYERESSEGGERGSGVIDLQCFIDCVEAPLTDHKKASNVFILIAKERGFFDQGRYYLSAETLIDMKNWVGRIKSALKNPQGKGLRGKEPEVPSASSEEISLYHRKQLPEPLYASIKEESIHRSNSMSTLPSLYGQRDTKWMNRSMDEDPAQGLHGVNHNLTYSYSSSEDSLNDSFTINFQKKQPRSAEASLRRTKVKQEITLPSSSSRNTLYEHAPSIRNSPTYRQSSPKKPVDSSDYLQKMYADMDRIDRQLVMVAKAESQEKAALATFDESDPEYSKQMDYSCYNASNDDQTSDNQVQKMELMMKNLNQHSQDLQNIFRKISSERISSTPSRPSDPIPPALLDHIAKYQETMAAMETLARQLIVDVNNTHSKVVQSLAECEEAKTSFLQLKKKVENVLVQLQDDARKQPPTSSSFTSEAHPLYAQVNKRKTKQSTSVDRRGSASPVISPARNSAAEGGGGQFKEDHQMGYHLRPRSLFNK